MTNLLDSLWKREACAKWCGAIMLAVVGGIVLVYVGLPVYVQLVFLDEEIRLHFVFVALAVPLLGLVALFLGVLGYWAFEGTTRLAAWLLLSKGTRKGFLKSRAWLI